MANNFTDPFAANLIGLWDFLSGSETSDTGLDDGAAQNGTLVGGALATGDQLVLDGNNDRFDVMGNDAPFDLDEGSIIAEFTQSEPFPVKFQTIVNRGEFWDTATEGFFEIRVTPEGGVEVTHTMPGSGPSVETGTGPGFFAMGDTLRTTYTWSPTGGSFIVENLTAGTATTIPVATTGLSMDIGGNDGTSFTFGARENVDNEFVAHFDGQIDYVAIYDARIDPPPPPPPGGPDGIVSGTPGDDVIDTGYTGDPDGDRVDAGDSIFPPVGSDNDIIEAGDGNDTVRAGDGSDSVDGGAGDDDIVTDGPGGGSGPDRGFPGVPGVPAAPADTDPTDDRDTVDGGAGNDTISTGDDADVIFGGEGDDSLDGGVDDDVISGGTGADTILGGEGNDTASGGDDDDLIDTSNPLSALTDRGFPGVAGVPAGPTDPVTDNDRDVVDGGAGNDTILTGDDADLIDGGTGDDSIDAGIDDDTVSGGDGNDTITGGEGNDSVAGDAGDDLIDTSNPLSAVPDRGFAGVAGLPGYPADPVTDNDRDTVDGGAGNDTILTGDDADLIDGGDGDDSIDAGIDDDTILGGAGADTLIGGEGNDSVEGGDGDDLIDTSNPISPLPDRGFPAYSGLPAISADAVTDNDLDTVFGGAGNDTILTGDDDDVIFGGDGNDSIDAGIDDDSIEGGAGDDVIIGGEGADTILGNDGSDTIYGGLGPTSIFDPLNIRDDLAGPLADPRPDNGTDLIFGGAGDDLIFGQDDSDTIDGGAGNDTIDGGIDQDSLFGGDDRDTFVNVTQGDTIDGGEGGDDFDTLDLRGAAEAQNPGGSLTVEFDPGNPENGTVRFFDADGVETGTTGFVNIERVICFTPGSLIATPQGQRPVEDLRPGDRVMTRDNGIQEIRWTGARSLTAEDLAKADRLRPVLIRKGALGEGLPERDMMLSPNHRMLIANDRTSYYLDESEVLVAAKHLVGLPGITRAATEQVTYIHFLCDHHEVVLADGTWSESFQPGDYSLDGLEHEQRQEIFELFPQLKTRVGLDTFAAARRSLKRHEAVLVLKG